MSDYTVHDVEARCPAPGCGVVRVLQIYGPPDKLTMDRLCDTCAPLPAAPFVPKQEPKMHRMDVLPTLRPVRRPYADD